MKKNNKIYKLFAVALLAAMGLSLTGCDDNTLNEKSVIVVSEKKKNDFDRWLEANYVNPYNISFKYRFEEIESDLNYYTVPADFNKAVEMAHIVKYICMESYDEVCGIDFTRAYFPKEFFLIGEWEYRNNGTFILGTAENGKKILLSGINYLDDHKTNVEALTYYYLKTIHHEFTHIINQTKDFPTDFQYITGSDYVADSWSESPYDGSDSNGNWNNYYYSHGFISAYAQESKEEDFAEMLSIYVCYPQSNWESILEQAGDAKPLLEAKLSIVRNYMKDSWNCDIDHLREVILRRSTELASGKIDLYDLTVK